MRSTIFTGVCTALVTPFSDGSVNLCKLSELLELQEEAGLPAVCLCGTTGEAATLSESEWSDVVREGVRRRGAMKLIVGTGSNSTETVVRNCRRAADLGADAVLIVTPYYNKGNRSGLLSHYVAAADASPCPIILYNVPSRTGVDLPVDVICELSRHPNVAGCKEASGNIVKTLRILRGCAPGFAVWSGNDDQIVPMCAAGAQGVISVISNLLPSETKRMTDLCAENRYAEAAIVQQDWIDLIDALFAEVNPIPIKRAMNLLGMGVGTTRLPLGGISDEAERTLRRALQNHDLL
ncbi:MAG: 4-hydroxy-tetrahydrodipicolinate synthase [Oscillospiraceae bacterium]|nr:4-hydroxy-tetrahydrodipicolinate synthase [Oscillospiraceae bacterium]MBR2365631.1 4-hydroxy-tetrahydrodipicolinate synthase [Oscillospiraceae bacterium]MBR2896924.1 4-hydroxy-tetrahydrodipicolinate synthase [Oscillospiraceae bacterium]MBR2977272.1 4-hydroxy-tetrahydrodipicolinate synthase [Oscillospiraceae bacterium]MBR3849761.1 4-hydroxy-tetrahydrodipicolinate synthase [Oscillospiraceae bacterium]